MPQDNLITRLGKEKASRPRDLPDQGEIPPPPPPTLQETTDQGDYAPPPDALSTWLPSPKFFKPELPDGNADSFPE